MDKVDCTRLATIVGCKPEDIACFYWGDGCEAEAGFEDGSGVYHDAQSALMATFGTEFDELVEGAESLPGLFDHMIHYVLTGETMEPSGGRHLSLFNAKAMVVINKARDIVVAKGV